MSYVSQEEKDSFMDSLFDIAIKGRVDPIWRLNKQLERCNMILATGDVAAFEMSVLALKGDLPIKVKEMVLARKDEFNSSPVSYVFKETCGYNIGTPDNPFISVVGHPEWEFLKDVPRPFQEENKDMITVISPIKDQQEQTDYIDLYEVIKEELEKSGTTWQYEKRTPKALKVQETLPKHIISAIVKYRIDCLMNIRKMYPKMTLGYRDLNVGWDETPPTPVFGEEEEEEK